jgi:hypothetical protein
MANGVDPNPGFLRDPRRKTLLGSNSKKIPVAFTFTERAESAGCSVPPRAAHFLPIIFN